MWDSHQLLVLVMVIIDTKHYYVYQQLAYAYVATNYR